jgi:hypothetical protein
MKTKNEAGYNVQVAVKGKAQQMKEQLDAQRKVAVIIPLERGEKAGTMHSFGINGLKLQYPKGKMIEVPEQIAQMISERWGFDLLRSKSLDYSSQSTKEALN